MSNSSAALDGSQTSTDAYYASPLVFAAKATNYGADAAVTMTASDDAFIQLGAPVASNAVKAVDQGLEKITGFDVGGTALASPTGQGLYIKYYTEGIQTIGPNGQPEKFTYTELNYQLIGNVGNATFGHSANGTPTVQASGTTVLGQGALIPGKGELTFAPNGDITGSVDVTLNMPGLPGFTEMDMTVKHAGKDLVPTSATSFKLDGGPGSIVATLVSAHTH